MKKIIAALVLLLMLVLVAASPEQQTFDTSAVASLYKTDAQELRRRADSLLNVLGNKNATSVDLRFAYHRCRDQFKFTEALTEYLYPNTAKLLNGALIPEADEEEGTQNVSPPEGLQVIEEFVYADSLSDSLRQELMRTAWRFAAACRRLEQLSAKQTLLDWQVMDAMKMEVIRVFALGITGFDTPCSDKAMHDNAMALEGVRHYLAPVSGALAQRDKRSGRSLSFSLKKTKLYLLAHPEFGSFDRMAFIRDHADPLYGELVNACTTLEIIWPRLPSPIDKNAKSIFGKDAMDPWFYARDNRPEMKRPEVAALGQILFFDPVLSGDQQRACASCHQPAKGFSDGNATSLAFSGSGVLKRNAPTIVNAAFQASYFYDIRVNFLEDQIRQVVNNSDELHGDFSLAVNLIRTSEEYRRLFAEAFKGTRDTAITSNAIVSAISAYERTLVSNDSRFDKHIRNEGKFMTTQEVQGFNLFMGKAQCATCHFVPMFNGTVPPFFTKTETEILGVPLVNDTAKTGIDSDVGRLHTSGMLLHKFAFKTSGLRNIALTAPYMHNGVFSTLNEVVDFYDRGGAAGAGEDLPTQTLPGEPLHLTATEKTALVKFMEALTDTAGLTAQPQRLPAFDDAKLNARKIGGVY
jgi:cytochrome c peroxidase